jgi:Lon protease-like protein
MPAELLPLFPLRLVALPQSAIPLHIFEERYKQMIGLCLAHRTEFGIVLAEENGIVSIGCTVAIEEVLQRYDDGRLDILCRGRRRFEIEYVDEDKDYLRAQVSYFDDDESGSTPLLRLQAISAWEQAKPLLPDAPEEQPDPALPQLSFLLGDSVPDLNARQVLLQLRSEEERLKQIVAFFSTYAQRQSQVTHVRRVAPTNGHSKLNGKFPGGNE